MLQQAWLTIYSEYCDLIGGIQISSMIRQVKELARLDNKISRIQNIVACLQEMYMPELVEALISAGYQVKYDPADEAVLQQSLNAVLSRLNQDIMKRKVLEKEMPKDDPKHKAHKPTYKEFRLTLMEISKFEQQTIRDNITTEDYCLYVTRLKDHIESLKTKPNGR